MGWQLSIGVGASGHSPQRGVTYQPGAQPRENVDNLTPQTLKGRDMENPARGPQDVTPFQGLRLLLRDRYCPDKLNGVRQAFLHERQSVNKVTLAGSIAAEQNGQRCQRDAQPAPDSCSSRSAHCGSSSVWFLAVWPTSDEARGDATHNCLIIITATIESSFASRPESLSCFQPWGILLPNTATRWSRLTQGVQRCLKTWSNSTSSASRAT